MGSTWSLSSFLPISSPSVSQLRIHDVLVLCEDGDLLLAREKLVDLALRVGVEFVVARDIHHMQRGVFPAQRVTSLPPWTSCGLLLRHQGVLHVVSVGANGLEFVPFEQRVVNSRFQIHDRFAIRRLRDDVRSEVFSSTLREFAIQIASIAPISWHVLLKSLRQQFVDREATIDEIKHLPPLVWRLLKRSLKLFYHGLTPSLLTKTPHGMDWTKTFEEQRHPKKLEMGNDVSVAVGITLEALGIAEVTARLSAAFVAAMYEEIHLLDPITANRSAPLQPAAFWSSSDDKNRLVLNPPTALGPELTIIKPT